MANKFSKALKHLKSTKIDEKLKSLDEATPTNHTKGLYAMNPPGFDVGPPDRPKRFFPAQDGTYPAGVPGTDGNPYYERPEGYWGGEVDWNTTETPDVSQASIGDDGKDTSGLIADDGTVKTFLPDGSRSFILGPLVDGWVLNHISDAYTNIGYIQKDTRQFVLLARVTGQMKADLYSDNESVPIWDGTSTGFTAYNENFTLAMAQWFRSEILATRYMQHSPYFYSGGVPQQPQSAADCPTCPDGMKGGNIVGAGGGGGSAKDDGGDVGYGQGGSPSIGDPRQGDPSAGDAEDAGFPWGLGDLFDDLKDKAEELWDRVTDKAEDIVDDVEELLEDLFENAGDIAEAAADLFDSLDDAIAGGLPYGTPGADDPFDAWDDDDIDLEDDSDFDMNDWDWASAGTRNSQTNEVASNIMAGMMSDSEERSATRAIGDKIAGVIEDGIDQALDYFTTLTSSDRKPTIARGQGNRPIKGNQNRDQGIDSPLQYNINLAAELPISIALGIDREMQISEKGAIDMANTADPVELASVLTLDQSTELTADNTINPPVNKNDGKSLKSDRVLGGGWEVQGGSLFNFNTESGKLEIVAPKTLRTTSGGERVKTGHGDNYSQGEWKTELEPGEIPRWFSDIPEIEPNSLNDKIDAAILSPPVDKFLGGLANIFSGTDINQPTFEITKDSDGNTQYVHGTKTYNNGWDYMKDTPKDLKAFQAQTHEVGRSLVGAIEGGIQGVASNSIALRQALQNFEVRTSVDAPGTGWKPFAGQSEVEKVGGAYGQVGSRAEVDFDNLKPEIQQVIIDAGYNPKKTTKESFYRSIDGRFIFEEPTAAVASSTTTSQPTEVEANSDVIKKTTDKFASDYVSNHGAKEGEKLKDKTEKYMEDNSIAKGYKQSAAQYQDNKSDQPATWSSMAKSLRDSDSAGFVSGFLGRMMKSQPEQFDSYVKALRVDGSVLRSAINKSNQLEAEWRAAGARHRQDVSSDALFDAVLAASSRYINTFFEIQKIVRSGRLPGEPESEPESDDDGGRITPSDEAMLAASRRLAELDKDIEKYSAEVKAAHAEMMKIAVNFGVDVALTLFGPALLRWGVRGLGIVWKGVRGASAAAKAEKSRQTAAKLQKLADQTFSKNSKFPKNWKVDKANDILNGWSTKSGEIPRSSGSRWMDSYKPLGNVLKEGFSDRQIKLIKEVKKEFKVPQPPKKYKMNFKGKFAAQNTPDKVASKLTDQLVASGNARGQKWRTQDKYWQGYETTERMNVVYDQVGHGDQAWERIIGETKQKNKWRTRDMQEKLNIIAHEKAHVLEFKNYESPWGTVIHEEEKTTAIKDPLHKKIHKRLKKDVAPKDPKDPPPKMVNGYHPKFGKKYKYDKLDPISAKSMPSTGNPVIDANVEKARKFPK